ncbi:MAG: N,N-dimethylformamidase beta subunit family domain-containing protein [Flavobacteriaceae bacterium]
MKYGIHFFLICCAFILVSCSPISEGYTDKVSYQAGDSLILFASSWKSFDEVAIELKDINGNTRHTYTTAIKSQSISNEMPYTKGFGYSPTLKIKVPDLESGVYTFADDIPFVVKPSEPFDILVLYSSNTENAYGDSGGKSLYDYNSSDDKAATIVSFQRPIELPKHSTEFLKWIATQNQYKIGYVCDRDLDDYETISNAKLLIITGHSEYWTRKARLNFDRFVDQGKNALILSGNTMWWQVRYSDDGNQMICYKSFENDPIADVRLKTVNWPDSVLAYSPMNSIGVDFNHGGYGKKSDEGWDGFKITNPDAPFFKGMDIKKNDVLWVKTHEYDGAQLNFAENADKVTLQNSFNFHRYELIGYDLASRMPGSNAAWVLLQKKPESGLIINTASTDWCAETGMTGKDSEKIKAVTLNMVDYLLTH